MSLKLKAKATTTIPPMKAGTYPSVCVGIIDIGEQHNTIWNKYENRLIIIQEFPTKTVEIDGEQKPRWLSQEFTASLHDKAKLSRYITQWRGEPFTEDEKKNGFDLRALLGEAGFTSIGVEEGKDGKQYNRINGTVAFPEGMDAPVSKSELLWFDLDEWDDEMFGKLPGWIQERIKKSTQYQKKHASTETIAVKADDDGEECPI